MSQSVDCPPMSQSVACPPPTSQAQTSSRDSSTQRGEGKGKAGAQDKETTFQWTNKARLLLDVTHDYKVRREGEGIDWESVRSKYGGLTGLLRETFPERSGGCLNSCLDLPHGREEVTAKILTTKLKAICLKLRQIVDNGRCSGYERVVTEQKEGAWGACCTISG